MSANSKIEWTEKTWNPIAAFLKRDITVNIGGRDRVIPKGTRGWFCVKCSPGCAHCYAEGINLRLGNGLTYLHRNLSDIEFRLVKYSASLPNEWTADLRIREFPTPQSAPAATAEIAR